MFTAKGAIAQLLRFTKIQQERTDLASDEFSVYGHSRAPGGALLVLGPALSKLVLARERNLVSALIGTKGGRRWSR